MLRFLILCGLSAVVLGQEKPWYEGICGKSKYENAGEPRIVGGNETRAHEFPWQVSLRQISEPLYLLGIPIGDLLDLNPEPSHICGGSIINKRYIVTAAHCVDGQSEKSIVVVVGEHNTSDKTNIFRKMLKVEKIIPHSDYNSKQLTNDIALIKVTEDIIFSENVMPVCKPDKTDESDGNKVFTTGWGATKSGGPCCENVLRFTIVFIMTNPACRAAYPNEIIADSMICATDNKNNAQSDSCQGDSGGPLVFKRSGTGIFALVGIVSWGYGCASGYPGVYTRVTSFNVWISSKIS